MTRLLALLSRLTGRAAAHGKRLAARTRHVINADRGFVPYSALTKD